MKSGLNNIMPRRSLPKSFAHFAVKNILSVKLLLLLLSIFIFCVSYSQNSDNEYRRPLSEIIKDIEDRYNISIRDPEFLIQDQSIAYADWKFRPDVERTLSNILSSVDLIAKKEGEKKYKIKEYEYHRITVKEGKQILDSLATNYYDAYSWEKRRAGLRQCIVGALKLNHLPPRPDSEPITTPIRRMNGYTIQNVAIEVLPGLYVCGSLYKPDTIKEKLAVVLCPNGHFNQGRYHESVQTRCAMLAKMGAMAFNYDLFGWGEYQLQFDIKDHRKSLAQSVQVLNSIRILDYLISLPGADPQRVGMTGASGGGSHTMLMTALDLRIRVSVPVAMLSCYFYGGCPCESGQPIHLCGGGTNNVELAAIAAPRPQLMISDGGDWTDHVPEIEYPYLQRIYGFYGKQELVKNVHFPDEGHDYGSSKRKAMYEFLADHLKLNLEVVKNNKGEIDESFVTIEEAADMYVFGKNGENLPDNAMKGFEELVKVFEESIKQ